MPLRDHTIVPVESYLATNPWSPAPPKLYLPTTYIFPEFAMAIALVEKLIF
jgi:hypothetical protein